METKPLLWVSTVMAICMSSRRFMGREWLVRDDFGIKFLVTFSGLYTFHLHSSHYIGCSQHVWLSRCGMSKGAEGQWAKVTEWLSSVAVRAPSMTLTKMVRQFVLGLAHTCRAHRAQAIHFIHTMPRMQSSLWSSGLWSLRCMLCVLLCASMSLKAIFFHCCSLQILSTVTTLFIFLYTQTELMNSWQITWWWRSTVAALTCGVAATWQPVWAHGQFNTIPGIIDMYSTHTCY